ncbi:TonB-dependent receptor [Biformimicrobium ophioploci]|uniref:TonB-dependent receptor n=1 Tax=Biformimicrobium ophioploci TaxID=3036711 RepID=A0ABQ6LVZ9_9GAMM|nr:TonB-dependent receptor [Microbulbifer sp. NKW57]GMG86260.1 TonB-dependent receptor [Microbulbifer sp. NKW57]
MNKKSRLALAIASLSVAPVVSVNVVAAEQLEEIAVTVSPLEKSADAVAAPVSILSGDELRRKAAATLGQTLESELGVANASFGGGVGLPVIRGQSANRVKVLQDNLAVADASNTSSDHANALEPLLAQRIEILRGPASLRYGSGAIGGVVNVIDSRIPTAQPQALDGAMEIRHNTVTDQDTGVFRLQGGLGDAFALYLDGMYRDSNDTRIKGEAVRHVDDHDDHEEAMHGAEDLEIHEEHEEEEFNTDGFVSNTNSRAHSYSFGGSWIGDNGFLGLSVNRLENNYGIPLGAHEHHHEEEHHEEEHAGEELVGEEHEEHDEHGEEYVRIGLEQTRYDLKGEHNFGDDNYWNKLSLRAGYTDYAHTEFEGEEVGTKFSNDTIDGRVELTAGYEDGLRSAYGLQWSDSDFVADGEEAFIQPSRTRALGAFTMQELAWDAWHLDLGARAETVSVDPEFGAEQDFNLWAASAGLQYFVGEHNHLSLILNSAERAPVAEELFADGFHVAESRVILGDSNLDSERSNNWEIGYHHHNDNAEGWHAMKFEASLYHNSVADYIYAANTGVEDLEEEADIYQYENRDATFYGAEMSVAIPVHTLFAVSVFGDVVRAEFDDGEGEDRYVPRMPPARVGVGLNGAYRQLTWDLRATRAQAQERAGANESATDAYTRVDLAMQYDTQLKGKDAVVFLNGRNLLDEEIRNSASLLRDVAPEAGRGFEAGVRFYF